MSLNTLDNIKRLLTDLKEIEANPNIIDIVPDSIKDEDGGYQECNLHPDIQEVLCMADSFLITDSGHLYYQGVEYLKQNGFNVTVGERDSFGPLSSIIHTSKGKIVFG